MSHTKRAGVYGALAGSAALGGLLHGALKGRSGGDPMSAKGVAASTLGGAALGGLASLPLKGLPLKYRLMLAGGGALTGGGLGALAYGGSNIGHALTKERNMNNTGERRKSAGIGSLARSGLAAAKKHGGKALEIAKKNPYATGIAAGTAASMPWAVHHLHKGKKQVDDLRKQAAVRRAYATALRSGDFEKAASISKEAINFGAIAGGIKSLGSKALSSGAGQKIVGGARKAITAGKGLAGRAGKAIANNRGAQFLAGAADDAAGAVARGAQSFGKGVGRQVNNLGHGLADLGYNPAVNGVMKAKGGWGNQMLRRVGRGMARGGDAVMRNADLQKGIGAAAIGAGGLGIMGYGSGGAGAGAAGGMA